MPKKKKTKKNKKIKKLKKVKKIAKKNKSEILVKKTTEKLNFLSPLTST